MDETPCRICGNAAGNRLHTARENMFGTRETFPYVECASCGCLQIVEIPPDLGRHYPSGYYSYALKLPSRGRVASLARRLWSTALYGRRGRRGGVLFPASSYHAWFRRAGVGLDSAILDVGSGSGRLLRKLRGDGFSNLYGVDPYVTNEVDLPGLRVRGCELSAVDGRFDLVMFHHSFEHIPDPARALREAATLLTPSGVVLVRIPVADSWAWRHYGADWAQLDAPRHLHLHTRRSLALVAAAAGLRITEVRHDSGQFQFWGSELCRRGISLVEPATSQARERSDHFSAKEVRHFRTRARALNASGEGDQACFFLERA